jgi:hypothetical protein
VTWRPNVRRFDALGVKIAFTRDTLLPAGRG